MKNLILSETVIEEKIPFFLKEYTKFKVSEFYSTEYLLSTIYGKYFTYYLIFTYLPQLVTTDIPTIYYNRFYWYLIYRLIYRFKEGDDSDLIDEFLEIQNAIPKEIDVSVNLDIEYYHKAHTDAAAIIEKLKANNS